MNGALGPFLRHRPPGLPAVMLCAVTLLLSACTLPALDQRDASVAPTPESTRETPLGRAVAEILPGHDGLSGIHPLADARDAFAARVLLTRSAAATLDVQYYIWRHDVTGTLLLKALLDAADRGVRVRMLLDDHGTAAVDRELAALNTHPQVEVRLFNPFMVRVPKYSGFLTDFRRLNRRMHNKSFTVDNQVTIVGGRNIGDEYFAATDGPVFADLDVLAVGPVVDAVSRDFDRYWASASSYPADMILGRPDAGALEQFRTVGTVVGSTEAAESYLRVMRETDFLQALMSGQLTFEWAVTRVLSDDPAKGLAKAPRRAHLMPQLRAVIDTPGRSVDLVSPYFVPTAAGVEAFAELVRQGVRVRVLTNALEATDVAVAHAGYVKYRKDLLAAGVSLFELRNPQREGDLNLRVVGPFGSSGSSLHAKTFAIDGERIFVGSFNFDPRSINLNTELGVIIESRRLARQVADAFENSIPLQAYELELSEDGRVSWIERSDEGVRIHRWEPGTDPVQRLGVRLLSILPIEWLL